MNSVPAAVRDAPMPLDTADSLIESLRGRPILRPEQFDELLRVHAPAIPDTQQLARKLIGLNWLTVYQAKKLISGKADELVIGQYVVLEKIGEGGMGKVFKATQLSLGRVVALKVVRGALLRNETALKRFQREVRAAAKLNHPNIVRVFDADQVGERHFLVMEYIAGIDLTKLVKERGPLPIGLACSVARQSALGLQHAHDQGYIHRDIKPSNLLIAKDAKGEYTVRSVVKILDMGLARIQTDDASGEEISTELTRTGTVIGTPDYMSPEQAKNSSQVDHRSDLYSLGCTLYFLLTGESPFPNGTPLEKLLQHQMDPPRPLQLVRMDVPNELATIVHTLLAKRPEDRFQSGAALALALEPWCSVTGGAATTSAAVPQAEAADSSATIDTEPHDPFDFADQAEAITPRSTRRPPPLPRHAPVRRRPFPMLIVLLVVLALVFLIGGVSVGIALAKRKKPEEPSPGQHEPKSDQPRTPTKVSLIKPGESAPDGGPVHQPISRSPIGSDSPKS
jgi:serine/threonine-protein kinase